MCNIICMKTMTSWLSLLGRSCTWVGSCVSSRTTQTSCAVCTWRHNMPPPLSCPPPVGAQEPRTPPSRRNVAVLYYAEYVPKPTAAAALCVNAALSKVAWWPWPLDLESGVRVTCDVGYLHANFGLPRPLCSRLRPDVCDRQTDVRQTSDKSIA